MNRQLSRRVRMALAGAGLLLAVLPRPAAAIDGVIHRVPPETTSSSAYTALAASPAGKVYVGTAFYGGSSWLCELDPATAQWKKIFSAHQVTRETGTGLDSQSKIHTKIQIDADGVVWLGTKQGNEDFNLRPEYGENPTGYPGGHLFSYDPRNGQVKDHGILKKQEGLMGGAVDNQRRRVYFWSFPKQHLLIYDLAANRVTDKGATGCDARYLSIDPKGRVFGTGRPGVLWMYDPETDKISELAVRPEGSETYEDPYVTVMSTDGRSIFGCAIGGKHVVEFDLTSIRLEAAGKETVPGTCGTIRVFNRAEVPNPDKEHDGQHAGTLGTDGCFYIANGHRLVRYNPKTKNAEDLGEVMLGGKPMERALAPQGAAVGPDGSLYVMYIYPLSVVEFKRLAAPQGGKP